MALKSTNSPESQPSFSMDDFAKALEQYDYDFTKGQIVRGQVTEYNSDGVFVDIGGKSPGFLPIKEIAFGDVGNLKEFLPLQSERDFLIIRGQDEDGQVTLSIRQLELKQAWENVLAKAEADELVQILVTHTNKGGVMGEVEGVRAFIPRSHLIEKDNLDSLVGQLLSANFLEVSPENNKLVLSQRKLARAKAMSQLQEKELVEGKIVKIEPYGVFVNMQGATGLLHIKQISNNRVDSLNKLFTIGQDIKVMIMEVDETRNRISLSTKVLENYPGEMLENMDNIMATAEERAAKIQEQVSE